MNIKAFLKLLDRYQKKKVTADEKKIMDLWYNSIDHTDAKQNKLDEQRADKMMWAAISNGITQESAQGKIIALSFWKRNFYIRLAAGCLLFVAGFIGYHYAFDDTPIIAGIQNEVVEKMNSFTNETSASKILNLPDGSHATLDPGATLYYPKVFAGNERRVYLKGDVFFEIAHDTTRPFYVHANNIVTKVLGTSFTIRENKLKNSIEVAVITGVVEVQEHNSEVFGEKVNKKVILTQNKTVTFYPEDEQLITGIVEKPKILKSKVAEVTTANFNYSEKPLPDIVKILEQAYGVQINIGNDPLRNCIITADLSQENTLFTQLEILCESMDAKYQLTGDSVTLTGKGCDVPR